MGTNFSQAIEESKERDSHDFSIEGVKIKAKESVSYVKKLSQELPNLEVLDVKGKLKAIPANINLLTSLQILRLTENKLSALPSEIGQCKALEEVDLSMNAFQKMPFELTKIKQLRSLNFASNQLAVFPKVFLTELETLILTKNELTEISTNICVLQKLRVLNLNENKITAIPDEIGNLSALTELHIRGNQLTSVNANLCKLNTLKHMDVSENQITQLPANIGDLQNLVTVEAQHNMISEFSEGLCTLEELVTLKLHDNNISTIPPAIGNLGSLNELYLQENKLKTVPSEIGKAQNLRKLYLEYNQLSSLPEQIADLRKLVILILHHNLISQLPSCIEHMTNLLRLSLNDNPLDSRTLEIIQTEGALALVNKPSQDTGGSKKFDSFQRRTSLRTGGNKSPQKNSRPGTLNPGMMRSNSVQSFKAGIEAPQPTAKEAPEDPKKKKKEKSKDAETGVPSYSTFKFAFDSLLEQQDFSKKKKEMLKKMSETEKWSLLNQYKGSTLELLRSQPKKESRMSRRSTNQKSAVDFVTSLKEGRVNKNTMNRTKSSLKDNKSGWASKFVEAGGISALSQYLATCTQKSKLSVRDHSMIKDCMEMFKILLDVSLKSVLTSSGAVAAIAIPLSLDNPGNIGFAVELLEDICSKALRIGAQLVFEAITEMSKRLQEEMPFFSLIQCLINEETPSETKALCLSLINQLIDSIDSLEERFRIRTEFMRMEFNSILDQMKMDPNSSQLIYMECELFEEETKNDSEDMRCRFERSKIIKRISPSGDGNLAITVVTDCMQTTCSVEITPDTTVGNIKQQIVDQFKIAKPQEYGIVSPADVSKEETWLNEEDIFAECVLSPEQMGSIEFRMIPWEISVSLPNGTKKRFATDPNITCDQVLSQILAISSVPTADYCLMLGNKVLQEAKTLERCLPNVESRKNLKISERPYRLRVVLGEDAWQMMEFDPDTRISDVFKQIAQHVGRTFGPENFQLVMESPDLDAPVPLEDEKIMRDYISSDNCSLRFVSRGVNEDDGEEEEECNIWDEPPDCSDNITFDKKGKENSIQNIETATLNKLVERVTSPEEYDVDFVNVFVMMYRAFTTEEKLWQKLVERFRVPAQFSAGVKQKIQVRVCIFVKNWVEKAGGDLHEKTRRSIMDFLKSDLAEDGFKLMREAIQSRLENPKSHEDPVVNGKPPIPFLPRNITTTLSLEDIEELEVARQLTLQSFAIYKKIRATEFFKGAWSKDKYKHLAPNILALIEQYNQVSSMFASIIVSVDTVRARAKAVQKVINIAVKLLELNNFHLVSAIVSGINNSAIGRLKFTHARISRRHRQSLQELESVVSMEGAFKNFREALANAAPPCIPFMGAYLTDLIFIADGNPDKIENRINFVKHKFVYNVVSRIQTYQTVVYNLEEVDSIQQFLLGLPQMDEKELFARSLQIEPRGAVRADIP